MTFAALDSFRTRVTFLFSGPEPGHPLRTHCSGCCLCLRLRETEAMCLHHVPGHVCAPHHIHGVCLAVCVPYHVQGASARVWFSQHPCVCACVDVGEGLLVLRMLVCGLPALPALYTSGGGLGGSAQLRAGRPLQRSCLRSCVLSVFSQHPPPTPSPAQSSCPLWMTGNGTIRRWGYGASSGGHRKKRKAHSGCSSSSA